MTILPPDSQLYQIFQDIGQTARTVFFAGLPGVGKSLLLKQFALLAHKNGRILHSIQWDVTRAAFEGTPENQAKYPEIDGSTQPIMRKAVGLWARQGIFDWHREFADPAHLLIGEVPLIGNRLIELVQKGDDAVESLLGSEKTAFFLPVPSKRIRQIIEDAREATISNPRNKNEEKDAQPNVLRALWEDVAQVGFELGLLDERPTGGVAYDPAVYTAVYQHLLQHRHVHQLDIDVQLQPIGSAYDLNVFQTELSASPDEVTKIMHDLENNWTMSQIDKAVAQWMNP